MGADEFLVLARLRIFHRAEKEHVLEKMGETFATLGVSATADVHVEGSRRLICLRIRDQKHAQRVVENEVLVRVPVVRALLDGDGRGANRHTQQRDEDNDQTDSGFAHGHL